MHTAVERHALVAQHTVQQLFGINVADDMVDITITHQEFGVWVFGDFVFQALLIFMQIKPDDVFTRRHGRRHGARFELKYVLNQLMFLLAQHASQRSGFEHGVNIIRGDVVITHHRQFENAENDVCQAVKEPHQRAEDKQTEAHRVDDSQCNRFRRNHTDAFRSEVCKQNEQAGDQGKGGDKAQLVSHFWREETLQKYFKGWGKRRITDDTAENRHRVQANLHHGKEHARTFLHFQYALRVKVAIISQQLEFNFAGSSQ